MAWRSFASGNQAALPNGAWLCFPDLPLCRWTSIVHHIPEMSAILANVSTLGDRNIHKFCKWFDQTYLEKSNCTSTSIALGYRHAQALWTTCQCDFLSSDFKGGYFSLQCVVLRIYWFQCSKSHRLNCLMTTARKTITQIMLQAVALYILHVSILYIAVLKPDSVSCTKEKRA